jgi:hypothetical protein
MAAWRLVAVDSVRARRYLSHNMALTNRERAARHRARLKKRGLRRAQLLVPDLSAPEMQARIKAACRKLRAEPSAELDRLIDWSDAAWSDTPGA